MTWSFCPVVDGRVLPDWRTSAPAASDLPPADLLTLLVDWPGEIALVHDPPILTADGQRDSDAEARLFRAETNVLAAYGYALAVLAFVGLPNPSSIHRAIARAVLQAEAPTVAADPHICGLLAQALADAASELRADLLPLQLTTTDPAGSQHTRRLGSKGWVDGAPSEAATRDYESLLSTEGMFGVDAFYAGWVERRYGDVGATHARAVREKARTRWEDYTATPLFAELKGFGNVAVLSLWIDPAAPVVPAKWPVFLCSVLWSAVVKPKLDRAAMRHAPAVPLFTNRALHEVRHHVTVRQDGDEIHALSARGELVGRFAAPVLNQGALDLVRSGLAELPRLTVERLLRGWARNVFDQARSDVNPFNRIVYDGGWEGLAEKYEINSKDRALLPRIVEVLSRYRGGRRDIPPLVSYWLTPAAPGRRAELRLDVGEALAPGFVHRLPKDVKGRERWLLPVLPEPHLFGRGNEHQALCDLQWEMLIVFRERVEDLAEGGVELNEADRQALADRSGLGRDTVDRALDEWSTRPDAWLRTLATGRFRLVDEGASRLLAEAAKITRGARRGGRANADKKRREPKHRP